MKPVDPSENVAAVQRLRLEGASVREIACRLKLARRTVRKILGLSDAPQGPRLALDERDIPMVLEDTHLARSAATHP
jgi:DNA invertase Pin-like site-specific DNA recombinase